MKFSKKLAVFATCAIFSVLSLNAVPVGTAKPAPKPGIATPTPKPTPAPGLAKPAPEPEKPAPRRLEVLEGKVKLRGRDVYISTPRADYLLILDQKDRPDFDRWDGQMISVEGYFAPRDSFEVVRIVKKPQPPKPAPAPAKPAPGVAKPAVHGTIR